MTIEYQLARITAQSKNADPKTIKGGLPELTPDDIRAAVSMNNQPVTYHALMAKYCGSDISESALLDILEDASMRRFLKFHPGVRINGDIHQRLVESAMVYFMSPSQGKRRSDAGNARHCGIDRKTWISNYRQHYARLIEFLLTAEADGLRNVRRTLARD